MITKVTAGHESESLHSSEEDDNMAVVWSHFVFNICICLQWFLTSV